MGYFSEILAQPAAQQAGRMTFAELQGRGVIGQETLGSLFSAKGLGDVSKWSTTAGGNNESGNTIWDFAPTADAAKLYDGYTFDWQNTGVGNTGTLTAFDPTGAQAGLYQQKDSSLGQDLLQFGLLASAGFGGAGLLGLGPLAGAFGGAGAAGAAGGTSAGAVDAAALGLPSGATAGAGGAGITGGGLSAAGGTYGTITAPGAALGAGGAGLSSGAGLTAPAFAGGGAGIAGGLGMTAGAGAAAAGGGLSGLLGGLSGYLPAASSLASLASGIYGMKLAGDAREASDPFAPYRAGYGQQLAALEANPGSIVSRPGFQAGLETIGRKSAASGYYGSGNMASALGRYSGDFYNQEANRLAGLAGAGQTPGAGQALGADLASQSLGSIGYGIGPLLQRLTQGG